MRIKQIWAEVSQECHTCKVVAVGKTVLWTVCTEGNIYFSLTVNFNYDGRNCYSFVWTVIKFILQQYNPYWGQCYSTILCEELVFVLTSIST